MKFATVFSVLVGLLVFSSGCGQGSGADSSGGGGSHVTQFAYVLNMGDGTIGQYSVGTDVGLAALATPTIVTADYPTAIAKDSSGKHVYVAGGADDNVTHYTVGTDGTLNFVSSGATTGVRPMALTFSADGSSLYTANTGDDTITHFSVGTDGELTQVASIASGSYGPVGMILDLSGKYAYVANVDQTVSQFSVANDGSLSALTPATIPTAACPSGPMDVIRASGGGEFLYLLGCGNDTIESFSIGADGTLTSVGTIPTGQGPQGMTVSGSHVYVTNSIDATVSMFAFDSSGTLNPVSQATVAAGVSPEHIRVDTTGKFAYVTDYGNGAVLQYSVGSDGALTPLATTEVSTGSIPTHVLIIAKH